MFTVVISEQIHLDGIKEYGTFLKPFLKNDKIAFCQWNPEGRTLQEAVPGLYPTVSRHERWRMIVLCDEEGLDRKNPFDLVPYEDPARTADMEDGEFFALRHQVRVAAYREAAKKPLVRLMTWMCRPPLVNDDVNNAQELDPEFAEYIALSREKETLRSAICGDYIPEISLPAEVICLAKRCYDKEAYDIQNAWVAHQDMQYSRFYDRNLYFDKMRYLVFDILPKNHQNYVLDYIRFLYSLMVLAGNETPLAALSPNRVYVLHCQNDESALRELLGRFEGKLLCTEAKLKAEISKLENAVKPRLSDQDAQQIFCANMNIPVSDTSTFNIDPLYISPEGLGLAVDCPEDEGKRWETGYQTSRKTLQRYLKTPLRALRKTTSELHRVKKADLDEAGRLNEFQLEDVETFTAEEELKMVATKTMDLQNVQQHTKAADAQDKAVRSVIERRMPKKWTIILGLLALVCYVIGFVPMFFWNLEAENGTLLSLAFFLAGGVAMAATAFITLFFLRRPLRVAYGEYNHTMKGVVDAVEGSLGDYSRYLTHACNMMRGHSVLNFCRETEDPDNAKIRVLKKHAMDVCRVHMELKEIFSPFLPANAEEVDAENAYHYDFFRPVDYEYPIPFMDEQKKTIDFLQPGNLVEVPVDFIKYLSIRREELYD